MTGHRVSIASLFATRLYRAEPEPGAQEQLLAELAASIRSFAAEDRAGIAWCAAHHYPGYTSYSSLSDLPSRAPCFADLKKILDRHVRAFVADLDYNLTGGRIKLDHLWVNLMEPGGFHSGHIHPHSVISGTFYVEIPEAAAGLRFEDPRLGQMMGAPFRRQNARAELRPFIVEYPKPGMLLLWESFLRHEVLRHEGRAPRLSVSFNYAWK